MKIRMGRAMLSATLVGAALALIITVTRHPSTEAADSPPSDDAPETSTSISMAASSAPSTPPPTSAAPAPSPQAALNVRTVMRKMVPGAEVGVEVYDQQTDTVLTSLDPTEQFPTMSVVKLLIAIDVLHQNNWVLPDQDEQQEITRMLSYSDDAIASELWEQQGGGALVTRDAALMGLKNTVPPTSDPGEWGDTRTTAQDLVTVYQYVADGMPTADHDLIYTAMFHAAQTAADGTDQYFGIPDGLPGTTWAIKQGWGSSGPKDVVNTTGLVGSDSRYVVIVLTTGSSSDHKMESAITSATAQLASLVPKS